MEVHNIYLCKFFQVRNCGKYHGSAICVKDQYCVKEWYYTVWPLAVSGCTSTHYVIERWELCVKKYEYSKLDFMVYFSIFFILSVCVMRKSRYTHISYSVTSSSLVQRRDRHLSHTLTCTLR